MATWRAACLQKKLCVPHNSVCCMAAIHIESRTTGGLFNSIHALGSHSAPAGFVNETRAVVILTRRFSARAGRAGVVLLNQLVRGVEIGPSATIGEFGERIHLEVL